MIVFFYVEFDGYVFGPGLYRVLTFVHWSCCFYICCRFRCLIPWMYRSKYRGQMVQGFARTCSACSASMFCWVVVRQSCNIRLKLIFVVATYARTVSRYWCNRIGGTSLFTQTSDWPIGTRHRPISSCRSPRARFRYKIVRGFGRSNRSRISSGLFPEQDRWRQ